MELVEKKMYPSQINSKTISTRIPAGDYVKFLQESIAQGINISDWLLIKIYSDKKQETLSGVTDELIEISLKDIENYIVASDDGSSLLEIKKRAAKTIDFWIRFKADCFDDERNVFSFSEENICSMMSQGEFWYMMSEAKNKKEPSLIDVRFQVIQLLNRKNFSKSDRDSFLSDFDELMEDIK
jgi:hypothetical protein